MMRDLFVYIMASRSKTLYVGVTNDLERRVLEHKTAQSTFTARYNITKLVYFEEAGDPLTAIEREKQIKAWRRSKKVELIDEFNPEWDDLAESWYTTADLDGQPPG